MTTNEKSILEAWHLIETLVPYQVAGINEKWSAGKFKDSIARGKISEVFLAEKIEKPWESIEVKEGSFQHVYYFECFEQFQLIEKLRELFGSTDEVINKSELKISSFSLSVNQKGEYIQNSIYAPPLMYLLKQLSSSKSIDYSKFEENYRRSCDALEMKAYELLANGIDSKALNRLQQEYERYFFRMTGKLRTFRELLIFSESEQPNSLPLQSFYTNDLRSILSNGVNDTLSSYLNNVEQENRLHIDENRAYIENILQPDFLPNGRWPSPVEHRLSLMQQVAVNQFFNENNIISSVNGPPGTGKTTLLKDIFAEIVVQRAEVISTLTGPSEVFIGKFEPFELDGYPLPYNVAKLNPLLSRFSMVVASSNNAAVENISKDLPKEKEVIRKKSDMTEYDRLYAEEASSLNHFTQVAENLIDKDEKAWGLFSASLGRVSNIDEFSEQLFNPSKEDSFIQELKRLSKKTNLDDWKTAVKEFNEVFAEVNEIKKSLQVLYKSNLKITTIQKHLTNIAQLKLDSQVQLEVLHERNVGLHKRIEITKQQLDLLPEPTWIQRLLHKKDDEQAIRMKKELHNLFEQLKENEHKVALIGEDLKRLVRKQSEYEAKIQEYETIKNRYEAEGLYIPDDTYWKEDEESYESRQISTPWLTDTLNFKRGLLFLKAMKLHKVTIVLNNSQFRTVTRLLRNRRSLNSNIHTHREILKEMWNTLHLITPLFSTTFASFSSMYKDIDKDFIDYLFIDEAGQASPQQAVGALWRSKRVLVVGDPLQIEPVVTTDSTLLHDVRSYFNVSSEYIDANASVQVIADHSNPKGMLTEENQWMGVPLWVHRRCSDPMFSISNEIAYGNKMVLAGGTSIKSANCRWYDCKGTATERQFVRKQGELLINLLMNKKNEKGEVPNHYVITPFTAIKKELKKMFKAKGFSEKWIKDCIGTVHTFQGKEADVVYFIVGTDKNTQSAAKWSCKQPNLINVAVTRAKKEFHVIGDYSLLSPMKNYEAIAKYAEVIMPQKV